MKPVKLSTRGLTKSFNKHGRELTALRDLTIDVQDGESMALAGILFVLPKPCAFGRAMRVTSIPVDSLIRSIIRA